MKFCPECDSMLYHIEEHGKLNLKCKICGYSGISNDRVIDTTIYKISNFQTEDTRNYSRYDPTLSRTIHKECPNEGCPSRKDKKLQEAVFYPDPLTMKLIYICVRCNTQWKNS